MPGRASEKAIVPAQCIRPGRSGATAARGLAMVRQMAASSNRRSALGWTSLHIAALGDHRREAEALLEDGADPNARDRFGHTPLFFSRSAYLAQVLICAGANVNARREDDSTPLHRASRLGNRQVARLLLDNGADVLALQQGLTPLHIAARHGHWGVVELLLERGADPEALDDWGRRPLDTAREAEHENVIRLLERRANGRSDR